MLDLLTKLFGRVVVPPAVIGERAEGLARGHDLPRLEDLPWVEVAAPHHVLVLPDKLGRGEQEAISVAVERHLSVLMDDYDARTCAVSLGLHVLGTFGILIIIGLGFRSSDRMLQAVRELAGE